MLHTVQGVDPALLMEADDAISNGKRGADPTIKMIAHFNGRLDAEIIIALNYRLMALAKFIHEHKRSGWVVHRKGKRFKLVHQALFRAAAITPLSLEDDEPVRTSISTGTSS